MVLCRICGIEAEPIDEAYYQTSHRIPSRRSICTPYSSWTSVVCTPAGNSSIKHDADWKRCGVIDCTMVCCESFTLGNLAPMIHRGGIAGLTLGPSESGGGGT